MSHFSTVRTRLSERDQIAAALRDLGYTAEVGDLEVRGFVGNTTRAEIRVGSGVEGYDLGFRREGQTYELVADWYGLQGFDREAFLRTLTQRYAYRVAVDQLSREGFTVAEQVVEADRTIRLTVRRAGE